MRKSFYVHVLGVCLLAPAMHATSVVSDFSVPGGTLNANNNPVSGNVEFTITDNGCFNALASTCLLVDITNPQGSLTSVNQSISDLSFHLFNSGSEVLTNGVLFAEWYRDAAKDPVQEQVPGGAVTNAPDNLVDRWHLDTFDASTGMHLDAIGGGQPDHLIGCCGQGQFSPYLVGHVIFELDGISGLSVANSTLSGVQFSYGTTGGEFVTGGCPINSDDCGGGGGPQSVPEPYSLSLVGGGLIAIGLCRRRKARRV